MAGKIEEDGKLLKNQLLRCSKLSLQGRSYFSSVLAQFIPNLLTIKFMDNLVKTDNAVKTFNT